MDHNLSRVQAHTDLNRKPFRAFRIILGGRLLHCHCGVAGLKTVVFMRRRRAEQRHNAVPHDLGYHTFMALNGVDHVIEHTIENLPTVLGVLISQELH